MHARVHKTKHAKDREPVSDIDVVTLREALLANVEVWDNGVYLLITSAWWVLAKYPGKEKIQKLSLRRVQRDGWEAGPAQSHREIWNS